MWRCGGCGSIHSRDDIDLARYYEHYPFKRQRLNWILRRLYSALLRRLRRAGLGRTDSILDFGCGSGLLVRFLMAKGYSRAVGYDPHTDVFSNAGLLENRYDWLFAQDVVEHVDDPPGTLKTFAELVNPGGRIVIGTPDAEAVDLNRPERFLHSLHQPYHRHVLSKRALLDAAESLGWKLQRLYSTADTNTRIPFLNTRFMLRYFRAFDNTIDVAFERHKANPAHLLKPGVFFAAFFGSFRSPHTEMLAVFRTSEHRGAPGSRQGSGPQS
jgi:2-polyprenyl-3-methyl-5-hydroxy-6-metoxy-1,4-benzoquinol methylase